MVPRYGPKAGKTAKASKRRNSRRLTAIRNTRKRAAEINAAARHLATLQNNAVRRRKIIDEYEVPMPWLNKPKKEMNELSKMLGSLKFYPPPPKKE